VRGAERVAADRRASEPPAPRGGIAGILDAILAGIGGRDLSSENMTVRALTARGIDPNLAAVISRNPQLLQPVLASLMGPRTPIVLGPGQVAFDGQGRPIAQGGPQQAPAGFEWVDPNDRSKGLRAIPGGPATHIPAEAAGRVAAMRASLQGLSEARRVYERAWGSADLWRQFWANVPGVGDVGTLSGEVGQAQRSVRTSIEAALRAMTGAAAPESEVRQYLEMYMPNARDSVESARQKLGNLERFMRDAEAVVTQGRTTAAPSTSGGWQTLAPDVRIREIR
jgi:hypothetical protein